MSEFPHEIFIHGPGDLGQSVFHHEPHAGYVANVKYIRARLAAEREAELEAELAQTKVLVQQALAFFKAPEDGDLMEEIEYQRHAHLEALGTSGEQLAQKDARIARLAHHLRQAHTFVESTEAFGSAAADGVLQAGNDKTTAWNVDESKAALNESPTQSTAAIRAEALREFADHVDDGNFYLQTNPGGVDLQSGGAFARKLREEADRIEREA